MINNFKTPSICIKWDKMVLGAALFAGLLTVVLFAGCSGSMVNGNRVAKVNDYIITRQEFDQHYESVLKMMNVNPETFKGEGSENNFFETMLKNNVLQDLIRYHLVLEEAQKRNIKLSEEELNEEYARQVAKAGGETQAEGQLKEMGMTKDDFLRELRKQLLIDKLMTEVASGKIKVTEDEARSYYDKNPKQFDQPEQVRARHILVGASPEQIKEEIRKSDKNLAAEEVEKRVEILMAEKKSKAEKLYNEVVANPEQFESIARKNSDDKGSAQQGGDLGFFSKEVMVPTFSEAAFKTKPGEIHEGIVESPFGYHIIQVVDRKAAEKKKFEDVKEQIISQIEIQRKRQAMDDWLDNKRKTAKIEIAPEFDFEKQAQGEPEKPEKKESETTR